MQRRFHILLSSVSLLSLAGCGWWTSKKISNHDLSRDVAGLPQASEPGQARLATPDLPPLHPGAQRLNLTSQTHVPVTYSKAGRAYIPVEGLLSDKGFARAQANAALLNLNAEQKSQQMRLLLKGIVDKISARATLVNISYAPEVGYFSGWVAISEYSQLRQISGLESDILISPRAQSNDQPHAARRNASARAARPSRMAEVPRNLSAQYSGLDRLGVGQFVEMVNSELGTKPTGERVRVGVTDTGITYAHPAFRSQKSAKQRISYMKDFTNEGAGFVTERAKISVKRIEDNDLKNVKVSTVSEAPVRVEIDAQILMPDAASAGVMTADANGAAALPFKDLKSEQFVLPETLVTALEAPNSRVRLGVMNETSFASDDEKVDINANGKIDDSFYFFVVPSEQQGEEQVYLDFSASKDMRSLKPLTDFNVSQQTVDVMSEKIGVSLTRIEIPVENGTAAAEPLTRIALVGFDPGNHGSHVAGIIGAQSTLSNDTGDTQARGFAPEVELMMNRVCSNNSGCNATRAIIDLAQNGARIINMSLGGLSESNDGYGVQETVINRLTEVYDVLFVISAGNSGPGRQTVGSPSTARHALSVAATATRRMIEAQYQWPALGTLPKGSSDSDEDFVMFFSSRGPTAAGGFKPNIAAPGTQLSSIQLNSAPGSRAGLDVYWGTSMAAPAATGAIALLLDAAQMYNSKNPTQPMPTDALTIRRVIMDSARPFRVNSFHPLTGVSSKGIYTWIDQGYGMVSLPQAWELLKKKAALQLPTGVKAVMGQGQNASEERPLALDYKVRVLRSLGNGLKYDGTQSFDTGSNIGPNQTERKYGQGVWLTEAEADTLVEVNINRSLRFKDLGREDVGDLLRQLNTSRETFALETVYYGAKSEWLKVGVPQNVACADDTVIANPELSILGAGALDQPVAQDVRSTLNPLRASTLNVCLKKDLIASLPPGDHGALIRAFKVVNGQRDVAASFEIPVYLTVPHHAASMQAKFSVSRQINSFMVDRHYVRVPKGVSVLRVSLELPKADSADAGLSCSGVSLNVLAGGNTRTPADLAMSGNVAQSCSAQGAPVNNRLAVKFTELNPKAGLWDLHVFGRYQFPQSTYSLNIDYATFAEIQPLNLTPPMLANGEFPVVLKESTFDALPDPGKSEFSLAGWLGETKHEIRKDQGLTVIPSASGKLARTYRADAGTVTITTTSAVSGLDIDLVVDECDDEALTICKGVAKSGTATADERGVFVPKAGKFYAVRIDPYDVPTDKAEFSATELINAHVAEKGRLQVVGSSAASGEFKIIYGYDVAGSQLIADPLFTSGQYKLMGGIKLVNAVGIALINVPVKVTRE